MDNKTVVDAFSILIRKDELIRKEGETGKAKVGKAVSVLGLAKSKNPFVLYDLGFEDLGDVAKQAIYVLKNKDGFDEKIYKKAAFIYKKIKMSGSIRLYEMGIKKFSGTEILNAAIVYHNFFEKAETANKRKRAQRVLETSGYFMSKVFLKLFKGVNSKKSEDIIKTLLDFNVIRKMDSEIKSRFKDEVIIKNFSDFFDKKVFKKFVSELISLRKIKQQYNSLIRKAGLLRTEGSKKPFFLFFWKKKKWIGDKNIRKEAGLSLYTFLEENKGVFNHSNLFKGINFSGISVGINSIEIENADLSGCNFNGIVFENCVFRNCSFKGAYLKNAVFSKCDLKGADFSLSVLSNSEFAETDLTESVFEKASMNNCKFEEKNTLEKIVFKNASLSNISAVSESEFKNCDFTLASLNASNLRQCTFFQCDFHMANLQDLFSIGSSFKKSTFIKADLCGCKMNRADLSGAVFQRATLSKSEKISCFQGASFFKADLSYARLNDAELDQADLLCCNLYLTKVDGASFRSAKHITGTEQQHIGIGTITGQKIIHRATMEKILRDLNIKKEDIHYGTILISEISDFLMKDAADEFVKFVVKNGGRSDGISLKYNFLNPNNFEKIENWIDVETPAHKANLLELINRR